MTYLEELETVIVKLHGCEAAPIETVRVEETFKGRLIWSGEVVLFEMTGCNRARRCYAWGLPDERGVLEVSVILEISPVDSAAMAVRLAIAAGARQSYDR